MDREGAEKQKKLYYSQQKFYREQMKIPTTHAFVADFPEMVNLPVAISESTGLKSIPDTLTFETENQ